MSETFVEDLHHLLLQRRDNIWPELYHYGIVDSMVLFASACFCCGSKSWQDSACTYLRWTKSCALHSSRILHRHFWSRTHFETHFENYSGYHPWYLTHMLHIRSSDCSIRIHVSLICWRRLREAFALTQSRRRASSCKENYLDGTLSSYYEVWKIMKETTGFLGIYPHSNMAPTTMKINSVWDWVYRKVPNISPPKRITFSFFRVQRLHNYLQISAILNLSPPKLSLERPSPLPYIHRIRLY